jgi:hypothetical protein
LFFSSDRLCRKCFMHFTYFCQKKIHNFARPLLPMSLPQSTDNLYWRQRVVQRAGIFTKLTTTRAKVRSTTEVRSFILMYGSVTTITLWGCVSTGIYVKCNHAQILTKHAHYRYNSVDENTKDSEEKQNITCQSTDGQSFKDGLIPILFSMLRDNTKLKNITIQLIILKIPCIANWKFYVTLINLCKHINRCVRVYRSCTQITVSMIPLLPDT